MPDGSTIEFLSEAGMIGVACVLIPFMIWLVVSQKKERIISQQQFENRQDKRDIEHREERERQTQVFAESMRLASNGLLAKIDEVDDTTKGTSSKVRDIHERIVKGL